MKPMYYYFGIERRNDLLVLMDPIEFRNDYTIWDFGSHELEDMDFGGLSRSFFERFTKERGLLMGFSDARNMDTFLKYGRLLSPSIYTKNLNVYFLDDRELVLFKLTAAYASWEEARSKTWTVLEPLGFITENESEEKTRKWNSENAGTINVFSLEAGRERVTVGNFYSLFVCLETDDYDALKGKVKEAYAKRRYRVSG